MAARKGFTLIEIIIVLVIIGVVAAMVLPSLVASIEESKAQTAQNNLLAIAAAQSKFNEDWSAYCISTGANPSGATALCGDNVADLNSNLHLGISDSFTYSCSGAYTCTAADGTDTLTLTYTVAAGSVVTCAGPNNSYCP